jgi:DNA-binding transcriptional MerR regulator
LKDTFFIGDLAGEFGITARTLRFYEDQDLLHPTRTGKTRLFSIRDRARLILILRGKRLGFSLAEIKEMLDLYSRGDGQAEQLRVTLGKIQDRVHKLESQKADIDLVLSELSDVDSEIRRTLAATEVTAHEV